MHIWYIHGLVQNCGNSIADAMELPQSYTKPFIYITQIDVAVYHNLT